LAKALLAPVTPDVLQPPIELGHEAVSNVGKAGYEGFVSKLKEHIVAGDIIQAVPSQRLSKRSTLHPFNAYRHLRQVNPSPYMFYLDCGDMQIVGASPETLCKVEKNKVYNHAIAGTTKRGKTIEEDEQLGAALLNSEKDRAEHIMLVDLARNDVNRVCKPETVKVDQLMKLEKFSHVIHITSQVSGVLRDGLTRFDAFRSIFPAGTVSGAPKIKAIELVGSLERERRGIYAGAVGRFDFASDEMDMAIAIRTMLFKNQTVFFQAGGGIVFDSVEEDEYTETVNKLGGNVRAVKEAEEYWYAVQNAKA
jgi:anthranilate synthase component 1